MHSLTLDANPSSSTPNTIYSSVPTHLMLTPLLHSTASTEVWVMLEVWGDLSMNVAHNEFGPNPTSSTVASCAPSTYQSFFLSFLFLFFFLSSSLFFSFLFFFYLSTTIYHLD